LSEPFRFIARFDVDDACFELEDILDEVHHLDETPLEGLRGVLMHMESPSLGFDNIILPNPLDHSHVSPMCSQSSPYPEYYIDTPVDDHIIYGTNFDLGDEDNMFSMLSGNVDNFMSLCYFSGCNASLDLYYMYLVDKPRKIMWNTFFDFSFDFLLYLVC